MKTTPSSAFLLLFFGDGSLAFRPYRILLRRTLRREALPFTFQLLELSTNQRYCVLRRYETTLIASRLSHSSALTQNARLIIALNHQTVQFGEHSRVLLHDVHCRALEHTSQGALLSAFLHLVHLLSDVCDALGRRLFVQGIALMHIGVSLHTNCGSYRRLTRMSMSLVSTARSCSLDEACVSRCSSQ